MLVVLGLNPINQSEYSQLHLIRHLLIRQSGCEHLRTKRHCMYPIRTSCKILVPKSCHTFRLQESCLYIQESFMYWQESYLFFTLQESCKISFQNQARILHVEQILARSWKEFGKILHKILARSWQNF